jgi:hypothetical protein
VVIETAPFFVHCENDVVIEVGRYTCRICSATGCLVEVSDWLGPPASVATELSLDDSVVARFGRLEDEAQC